MTSDIIFLYFPDLSPEQKEQFNRLEELYAFWNSQINVISRKDIDSLYEKHVLHSLSFAAVFDFPKGVEIVDIGTGGGFPGVPLAIFFPDVKFHLVDSIAKKLKIIEAVKTEIGLTNLTTQHTRAEDIKGRKFDFAVSRAVAPLKELWSWSKPLLKKPAPRKLSSIAAEKTMDNPNQSVHGLICLKGGDLTKEIEESNSKPLSIEIYDLFKEEYFKEKYILFVT